MKTIEKKLPVPSDFVIPEGIELQDALFFDIETTGLSRDYHKVYLIGSLCIQDGKFLFCQWLAEKETEEGSVLSSFFSYACRFTTLISFNGNRFDFPFLQSRMSHLGPVSYTHLPK